MKKLVLFAAAIVAISFASCTNTSNTNADATQDTTANVAPEAPAVVETPVVEGDSAAAATEVAPEAAAQ